MYTLDAMLTVNQSDMRFSRQAAVTLKQGITVGSKIKGVPTQKYLSTKTLTSTRKPTARPRIDKFHPNDKK